MKSWNLLIVAASALAALAVGLTQKPVRHAPVVQAAAPTGLQTS